MYVVFPILLLVIIIAIVASKRSHKIPILTEQQGENFSHNIPILIGRQGEMEVHNILMQLPDEYYLLEDVILKTPRSTTQIDHIVVSKHAIFAIETKNYRGQIYGNEDQINWRQVIVSDVTYPKKPWKTYTYVTKNLFYNPIKQAISHTYAIKEYTKEWPYLKVIPIVVFMDNADISKISTTHHVIYDADLLTTITAYKAIYATDNDVVTIFKRLAEHNLQATIKSKTHIQSVQAARLETNRKIQSGICPHCGGTLTQRTGRYGTFYGCSNYPKCKFTYND